MNHELYALLGEQNITHMARIGRLRWAGHVARMDVDSLVRLLFDRKNSMVVKAENEVTNANGGEIRLRRTLNQLLTL